MALKIIPVTRFATKTKMREQLCLGCGYFCDTVGGDCSPAPGDLSLCLKCGTATFFCEDFSLRMPTEEEQAHIDQDPEIVRIRTGVAKIAKTGIWQKEKQPVKQ